MRLAEPMILALTLVLGAALQAAAQPPVPDQGLGTWWGALAWIFITLVLIVAAAIFVVKGIKQPNRR